MKIFLMTLFMIINVILIQPCFAEQLKFSPNPDAFAVGQQVIWHYQTRSGSSEVQKIPAEVVKIGNKRVQIQVRQSSGDVVKRWANANKLEIPNQ